MTSVFKSFQIDLVHGAKDVLAHVFTVLDLGADFVLPMWWALGATIPIFALSWWFAYRTGWF